MFKHRYFMTYFYKYLAGDVLSSASGSVISPDARIVTYRALLRTCTLFRVGIPGVVCLITSLLWMYTTT